MFVFYNEKVFCIHDVRIPFLNRSSVSAFLLQHGLKFLLFVGSGWGMCYNMFLSIILTLKFLEIWSLLAPFKMISVLF